MMLNAHVRNGWRGVWSNADTCGQGGGGYENGSFLADVLYGRPLKEIYNQFKFPKKMIFNSNDRKNFKASYMLGKDRVRDYCHWSGKFKGAAHNECNLNYKIPKFIPVVFHNLSCYDSHLFVKKLRGSQNEKIKCIPNNEEKYILFSRDIVVDRFINKEGKESIVRRELRFIDSFRFMSSSLDSLSKNLNKGQCKNLGRIYSDKNQLDLLVGKKGIYPYEYLYSIARLNDTELPPKSAFYSRLNDSDISDKDYEHAKSVWKCFGCKTLREYHNLYN